MKTQYEIYMDFQKAMELVNRLRSMANKINSLADENFQGSLTRVKANWTGENAEAFLAKGGIVKNKVSATAQDILKTADAIAKIAERTKEAELAAITIAQE